MGILIVLILFLSKKTKYDRLKEFIYLESLNKSQTIDFLNYFLKELIIFIKTPKKSEIFWLVGRMKLASILQFSDLDIFDNDDITLKSRNMTSKSGSFGSGSDSKTKMAIFELMTYLLKSAEMK